MAASKLPGIFSPRQNQLTLEKQKTSTDDFFNQIFTSFSNEQGRNTISPMSKARKISVTPSIIDLEMDN